MSKNIKYIDKVLAVWEDTSLPLELRAIYGRLVRDILLGRNTSFSFYQHKHMVDTGEDIALLS